MIKINLIHTFRKKVPERSVYQFKVESSNPIAEKDLKIKLLNVIGLKSSTNIKSEIRSVSAQTHNYELEVYE